MLGVDKYSLFGIEVLVDMTKLNVIKLKVGDLVRCDLSPLI